MQKELRITDIESIKALHNTPFLGHFFKPQSPSDVARALDMPANLMHHHVQRLTELGLLQQVDRKNGKVYYQLAASTFLYPLDLWLPEEMQTEHLENLSMRFRKAYARSERWASGLGQEDGTYSFSREHVMPPSTLGPTPEARPAHMQVRTVRLSAARYRQVVEQLYKSILDLPEDTQDDAKSCTLALLAFEDEQQNSHHMMDTYMPI